MSDWVIGVNGVAVLVLLLSFRMWIGLAMAVIGFFGCVYLIGIEPGFSIAGTVPFKYISFYPMAALPLFILMGVILSNTGVGEDLFTTARTWMGQMRGGLAVATVLASAVLAAIMGDTVAETVTVGKVAVPQMLKHKYDKRLATGSIAAGGTLGILIPPSLGFILYGILTEQPVGLLFIAGILPGILLTLLYTITIIIITARNPLAGPPGPKTSFKDKIGSLKETWPALVLLLAVLGTIYGGICTPTEAAAIGAFGAIIIALSARRLDFKNLVASLREATEATAMCILLIMGAFILMKFLAISKLPIVMAEFVSHLNLPPYAILAAIVFLYLILGMFLDIFSAVVLTLPVIYPTVTAVGFDPIWFGVVIVLILEMGLISPPVGPSVFALAGTTGIPAATIYQGIYPYLVALLICIIIVSVFPQIALFLPSTM